MSDLNERSPYWLSPVAQPKHGPASRTIDDHSATNSSCQRVGAERPRP